MRPKVAMRDVGQASGPVKGRGKKEKEKKNQDHTYLKSKYLEVEIIEEIIF